MSSYSPSDTKSPNSAQETNQETKAFILNRLRERNRSTILKESESQPGDFSIYQHSAFSFEEKCTLFIQNLAGAHAEVYDVENTEELIESLQNVLIQKNIKNLLISSKTSPLFSIIDGNIKYNNETNHVTKVQEYIHPIEDIECKSLLFNVADASITSCLCGIAQTGSIVLTPDANEPRLMSLVPPVHIVIVKKDTLFDTFYDVIQTHHWHADSIPTNIVLISGPSKTADIEQTLVYGVHGPKALVVFLV